jgi:hypothetical protein
MTAMSKWEEGRALAKNGAVSKITRFVVCVPKLYRVCLVCSFFKFVDKMLPIELTKKYSEYKLQTSITRQIFYPIRSSGGTRVFVIPPSNR